MEADASPEMPDLEVRIDPDDTWQCRHVDESGAPAPPTRLRLGDTFDWPHPVQNSRRWLNCPDCGTRWRVWAELRKAKPSVNVDGARRESPTRRLRLSPVRDVDRVIELIRGRLPSVSVSQHENAWPADDDGLWFFGSPGLRGAGVQIESWNGRCPFLVEGARCRTAESIDEVVRWVLEELGEQDSR